MGLSGGGLRWETQGTSESRNDGVRVLHVVSSLDVRAGGTTAAVLGMSVAQARAGAAVTVLATFRAGYDPSAVSAMREEGVNVTLVGPVLGPLAWCRGIRAKVQRAVAASDIVHIHALWEEIQHQAAVDARRSNVPYIITPHGMLDPWSLSQSRWKKWAYMHWRLRRNLKSAAALHYTARIEKQLCDRLCLRVPGIIVPNGIDLSEYRELPRRDAFRERYQIQSDVPLVLFLGRLHPKKGCEILIKGFAQAIARKEDAVSRKPNLVIAGPDSNSYQRELEALVSDCGLQDAVHFVGPLYAKEKLAAYVDADLFALISYQENFGIAVIEALAAGCPVLLSDQVNIHDLVETEQVGWVVPTEVDATARALRAWLQFVGDPESMRTRARAAASRYDWQSIASSWMTQYEQIICASRSPTQSRS